MTRSPGQLAGRTYHYFGSKDVGKAGGLGGKEAVYLIAVNGPTGDTERLAAAEGGVGWWSVERGWKALADYVEGTASVAKMASRIELAFSGTVGVFGERQFNCWRGLKQDGDGSMQAVMSACAAVAERSCASASVGTDSCGGAASGGVAGGAIDVIEVDDIYGSCGDGDGSGSGGDGQVMTDGTGLISYDLAEQLMDEINQNQPFYMLGR